MPLHVQHVIWFYFFSLMKIKKQQNKYFVFLSFITHITRLEIIMFKMSTFKVTLTILYYIPLALNFNKSIISAEEVTVNLTPNYPQQSILYMFFLFWKVLETQ